MVNIDVVYVQGSACIWVCSCSLQHGASGALLNIELLLHDMLSRCAVLSFIAYGGCPSVAKVFTVVSDDVHATSDDVLVGDEVVDCSTFRRRQPAIWRYVCDTAVRKKYGEKQDNREWQEASASALSSSFLLERARFPDGYVGNRCVVRMCLVWGSFRLWGKRKGHVCEDVPQGLKVPARQAFGVVTADAGERELTCQRRSCWQQSRYRDQDCLRQREPSG